MVIYGNIYRVRRLLNNKPHSLTMKLLIGLDQFNLNARAGLSNKLHSKPSNTCTHAHTFFKRKNTHKACIYWHIFITNGTNLTGHYTFLRLIFLATLFKKLDMISKFHFNSNTKCLYQEHPCFLFSAT